MSGARALRATGITVAFAGRVVLDVVDLEAAPGEIVALQGRSGSGKSTLLRVIAGLLAPSAGRVEVGDEDVTHVPVHRRGIGMVFQDEQLFPHLDVAGNIGFGLRMHGVPRRERAARTRDLLDLVGLRGFEARGVASLSGGEAKRVALARSLAPRPSVLLLDEPLTGLDRELHDELAVEVRRVLRDAGMTAVLVTHDPEEAALVADRVEHLRASA